MVRLSGTPIALDGILGPAIRVIAGAVGLAASLALVGLGAWWWVPVPLVTGLLAAELWLWRRGDRPAHLTLDATHLRLEDATAGRTLAVPLAEIHTATVHVRPTRRAERLEAVLVLTDRDRVRFAARFLVEPDLAWHPDDVRVDTTERLLGAHGGLRSMATGEVTCRQVIDDPAGQALRFLRERLPAAAWDRTALRVWRGAAPPLDAFGLHQGDPQGLLVLDGDRWTLREGGRVTREGLVTLVRGGRALREAELLVPGDGAPVREVVELPLLVLELEDEACVVFPAPEAARHGTLREADEAWLHTHVAEGAALVWHVLTRWPDTSWPALLRRAAHEGLVPHPAPGARSASRRAPSPSRNR
ncbi:MAG: hypothetical protein H6732_13920 [Alphaproteobacteria bacterium]|nr:hypothetical protein [Alphaproteobacteria bacterium]